MTCGVCGVTCRVEPPYRFFEGAAYHEPTEGCDAACWPPRPHVRDWTITAPLYFKAAADGRGCEVPFCGAKCATAYFIASSAKPAPAKPNDTTP